MSGPAHTWSGPGLGFVPVQELWNDVCGMPVVLRLGVRTSTHMEWARTRICPSAGVVEWHMWHACGAEVGWQDQHTHGTLVELRLGGRTSTHGAL